MSNREDSNQTSDSVMAVGVQPMHNEESHLFSDRQANSNSLTSEQAFMHMVKAMLGLFGQILTLLTRYSRYWTLVFTSGV
jgi:hypothetical protein